MTQDERLKDILDYLKEHGKIRVDEICERYEVSRDTARRDLVKLEDTKLIVRIHGGAMLSTFTHHAAHYEERFENCDAKLQIGQRAAELIKEGEHILMDASTTVHSAAEAISVRNVVVVTNSIDVATTLGKKDSIKVHLLGGEFNAWNRNVTGIQSIEMLRNFRVQTLFIGACGLTLEGLNSPLVEEAYLKREMIRRADRVVVLADSSKFNKVFFHHVCSLEEIDVLITDREPPTFMQEAFKEYNIEILITRGGESCDY
jgi:DeoR/GlpR family transcriptional regulator of sugar metabolism